MMFAAKFPYVRLRYAAGLFCVFIENFSSHNATGSPFVSGLSAKGGKRTTLTLFHGKKGGENL